MDLSMFDLFAKITTIYLLYLFYDTAFLFLGVSIAAKDMKGSDLQLADRLWLLGMFGFLHGAHEWLELRLAKVFAESCTPCHTAKIRSLDNTHLTMEQ